MNNIMNEIYFKYKKSLLLSNKHKNKLIDVINSKEFFIAINDEYNNENIINPMIVPMGKKDIVFMIFENEEIANSYKKLNNLENKLEIKSINKNAFYILIQELFLRGITGVILQGILDDKEVTLYYPILELINYEKGSHSIKRLYTKDKQDIISYLNYVRINDNPLSYIYRKDLSAQEVALYLVKYHIFDEKDNRNVKLFITEDLADDFCKKNNIYRDGEAMNTTAHNGILFSSLANLSGKVDNIYFYTYEKTYKLPLIEFIELLAGVGFEQTDLIGK